MISNAINGPEYHFLAREYDTILKLETDNDDKLAVKNGSLEISKGGFLQAPTRTVKNLFQGGYNRNTVIQHLTTLAEKTEELTKEILNDPQNIKNFPAEIKHFQKKIKAVASILSSYGYNYRDNFKPTDASQKFSVLYDRFSTINENLKNKLKDVSVPEVQRGPIDFDEPIQKRKIKAYMSKHHTVDDVVHLAQSAEKQIVPLWKKIGIVAAYVLSTVVVCIPLSILQTMKWVLWNPVEFILKGKVTSERPLDWWVKNCANIGNKILTKAPQRAIKTYAQQLLQAKVVTDENIDGFIKLLKHVKKADLSQQTIGFTNLNELLDEVKKINDFSHLDFNFGIHAQAVLEQMLQESKRKVIPLQNFKLFLFTHYDQLLWLDNSAVVPRMQNFQQWRNGFQHNIENVEERKAYFMTTISLEECFPISNERFISHSSLLKLIDAVGKQKHFRKIEIRMGREKYYPQILETLKKNGFIQNPDKQWEFIK